MVVPGSGPWQSPGGGRPVYARPVLAAILALAAVLFAWDLRGAPFHSFYSETVRSMSLSWKGFVFGSFDPGGSISVDKLPGFMWPQALSVRIFGFRPWAITLPQVIEGVLSVAVLYRAVRRWAGVNAGLLAAGAFTLTPVIAGLFRTEVEDPVFTLCLLLAGDAALRAAREARLRSLVLAGVWVGLGFQAKMLEAWAVLPALAVLYLVAAPTVLRRRLGHLAVAGVMCVAVSLSWVLLVTVTPAKDRPYVDGTTDNSAISQVVGYNFLNRFSSLGVSAEQTGSVPTSVMAGAKPSPSDGKGQTAREWAKMFGKSLSSQVGWLYPAVALSAVCGVLWRRRRPRTDLLRAGFLMWGVWLATFFMVFSAGAVGAHIYYMGIVAVPIAALFGAGTVQFWRAWRTGDARRAWALPTAVASTAVWSALCAQRYPSFVPFLAPVALALGAAALTLLGLSRKGADRAQRRVAVLGLGAGLAAMLLPPAVWASSVLNPAYAHSGMGAAGPVRPHHTQPAQHHVAEAMSAPDGHRSGRHTGAWPGPGHPANARLTVAGAGEPKALDTLERSLLAYTGAHRNGARFLFATTSWRTASPFILYAGAEVLPMGGFTGMAPSPTPAGLRHLVTTGQLRYVLLGGPDTPAAHADVAWVRDHCARVPGRPEQLYLCTAATA
ncbi:mannosyltransferase [Streptomyces antnestii]|uniref:Mannosyltransferase n=1 Tax=Streptomyces antnestii TaxID=2494256 RepID=A0A3S2YN86_9ACTN|nr:mannosyltransferase [Streptomyces sp. San01]